MDGVAVIDELEQHAKKIAEGRDPKVRPGARETFTEGCTVSDAIRQGDVYIDIIGECKYDELGDTIMVTAYDDEGNPLAEKVEYKLRQVPEGASESELEKLRQMVPGVTVGAKHCLSSLDGVKVYMPPVWNEEELDGPVLALSKPQEYIHPTHGPVVLLVGQLYELRYQRNWDVLQKKIVRAAD